MFVWDWKGAIGVLTTNKAFEAISDDLVMSSPKWWENPIWKWRIPLKVRCLLWLGMENKILT